MCIHKMTFKKLLSSLKHIQYGTIILISPDGISRSFTGTHTGKVVTLRVHDWSVFTQIAFYGDVGFAGAYKNGLWDCSDLVGLFSFVLENELALSSSLYGNLVGRLLSRFSYLFTRNSLTGSKKNIHLHYDLGNEFYKLWLDPTMSYSSALFDDQNEDLTIAQNRKYDRILEKLNGNNGKLLEIGCGWGGFAKRALEKKNYEIKGITLSTEQRDYAKELLQGKANIVLEDYRHQEGQYDHIVSIEMFEAVGEDYWSVYFSKIKSLLTPKGRAIVQTITIDEQYFLKYKTGGDAIRSFIFPGGMLPTSPRFCQAAIRAKLRVREQFSFGQDYALTIERWLQNFDNNIQHVRALGFDDPFIRLWRFYLTCCIASFRSGRIDVMQMELRHAL